VKAKNVKIKYSKATFYGQFGADDVSCCDCFHPSLLGQSKLAELVWSGLKCSAEHPCCGKSTDPFDLARCIIPDHRTFYRSGFWPRSLRKLVPPAP